MPTLTFSDFYDIADYGNKNWKGSFTPKEIAQNAYDYMCEYLYSINTKTCSHTIEVLLNNLEQDLNDETQYWYDSLVKDCK